MLKTSGSEYLDSGKSEDYFGQFASQGSLAWLPYSSLGQALALSFQMAVSRCRQCRYPSPNYSDDWIMNIFDIELYASRCQNPHGQKKVPSQDAGHLRNYFNERGLATKQQ